MFNRTLLVKISFVNYVQRNLLDVFHVILRVLNVPNVWKGIYWMKMYVNLVLKDVPAAKKLVNRLIVKAVNKGINTIK